MAEEDLTHYVIPPELWVGGTAKPRIVGETVPCGVNWGDVPQKIHLACPDRTHMALEVRIDRTFRPGVILLPDYVEIVSCRVWKTGRVKGTKKDLLVPSNGVLIACYICTLRGHHYIDERNRRYSIKEISAARARQAFLLREEKQKGEYKKSEDFQQRTEALRSGYKDWKKKKQLVAPLS